MTFYEAAVEVLRRSGRPLHFKKITEVALRDELLSHVGKTPELTMEDRLDLETKKEASSWIVKTRPGVYMLRGEVAERLNAEAAEREEEDRQREEARRARELEEAADEEESEAEDDVEEVDEDDDEDDSDEEEDDEDEEESDEKEGGKGRRRRRRRGRGRSRRSRKDSKDSDEPAEAESSDDDEDEDESDDNDSEDSDDAEDSSGSERKSRRGRGRGRRRGGRGRKNERSASSSFDDLDGERFESIAEAAFGVIQTNGRRPMSAADVASVVFDKKLVKFHTHDPEVTIESAIVTDNQVRERSGRRPLFSLYREGRWGLTEWGVTDEGIEKEQNILKLASSLRSDAHEQLGEAISRLKSEAFEMVVMTLLERLDYRNLKVSKRTSDGDTYFSADWRRGFSDMRVCVYVVSNHEATLDADAVAELRETLEHYSAAEGIIIHMGDVSKGAVSSSRDEEQAKVTIIDRKSFVRLLVDEGIGVRTFQTPLVMVDTAFIDALQR